MKFNEVSLQVKIVGALGIMFLVVLVAIVTINHWDQQRNITAEVYTSARILGNSVYNSILHPMAVGDDNTIKQQMADFKTSTDDASVLIFGVDRSCTYSSEKAIIGTDVTRVARFGRTIRSSGATVAGWHGLRTALGRVHRRKTVSYSGPSHDE